MEKMSGLYQSPIISAEIQPFIQLWSAGFKATHGVMAFVIETGMSPQQFLDVAESRMPLIDLIRRETDEFKRSGWQAIEGVPPERRLSRDDRYQLSLFRHDIVGPEGAFNTSVSFARVGEKELLDWYNRAQHIYRLRPALGQMIRSICSGLFEEAGKKGMNVIPTMKSEMHFREEYHEKAKRAFRNLIINAIVHGEQGGTIRVWDDEDYLFFENDGPGMYRESAKKLGHEKGIRESGEGEGLGWWQVGEIARELGWKWDIVTDIGKPFVVRIRLNPSNFIPPDKVITREIKVFTGDELPTHEDLIAGANVFIGAEPFQDYRMTPRGKINIMQSPIYLAIKEAARLVEFL